MTRGGEEWIQKDSCRGLTLGGVGGQGPAGLVRELGDGWGGTGHRGQGTQGPWATDSSWDVVCSREAH